MGDYSEVIRKGAEEILKQNLFSDTFASVALEDIGACQHVVRTILGRDDIEIISVKSQYRLLNITSKDTILDAFAQDSTGRLINIEIQRSDTIDHARRIRYYGSMIDKSILDKGAYYDELPDVYIIYISETDLLDVGETVYPVKKTLGESGKPYDDGNHVIFVNAAIDDGSDTAKLMKYFGTADPEDMTQGPLSERVHFLKREKGGHDEMCKVAEDLYNQGKEQGIEQGIEKGIEKGQTEKAKAMAISLHESGVTEDLIAKAANVSVDLVRKWLGLSVA
ncbi:MAG: Rpn family recombination-promoting nuclease/putative transposase [Oscillospiraceae bacterium]|nr:Rpn family recombination-promoting nuclease/putative transposase [Oscillospiraceae bacterium]